jgi:hypothetical protein
MTDNYVVGVDAKNGPLLWKDSEKEQFGGENKAINPVSPVYYDGTKYRCLLYCFRSPALRFQKLTALWVRLALRLFFSVTFGDHTLLIADGLKSPKEGTKMPAVKSLHQASDNNSKATFSRRNRAALCLKTP